MKRPIRILLQTTIPETKDDWHIGRFSLLRDHLASLKDEAGHGLCQVTARNRESDAGGNEPVHELLHNPSASSRMIRYFPAHPHEGAVGVPDGEAHARVIAIGKSRKTGRTFNLVVAFERAKDKQGHTLGRGIAEASFHHFVDYNWDTDKGAPSFVGEPPGDGITRDPNALDDIKTYVRNLAIWLAPSPRE